MRSRPCGRGRYIDFATDVGRRIGSGFASRKPQAWLAVVACREVYCREVGIKVRSRDIMVATYNEACYRSEVDSTGDGDHHQPGEAGECESDNVAPNGRKRADLFKAVSLGHGR